MMFYFSVHMVQMHGEQLPSKAKALAQAAESLCDWYKLIFDSGPAPTEAAAARATAIARQAAAQFKAECEYLKPKFHAMIDMSRRMHSQGNPAYNSTYPDETFNCFVARIARSVHSRSFAESVLCKYWLQRTLDRQPF